MSMTLAEFHNALRVFCNIDYAEFADAIREFTDDDYLADEWTGFRNNPWRWFIKASDGQAEALFKIIESRQPKEERT